MVLGPVEVIGSTIGGADKVKVEIYDGTELGSLNWSLDGSNDGILYGSLLGDSLLDPLDDSFDGSNDGPPEPELIGDSLKEAACGAYS